MKQWKLSTQHVVVHQHTKVSSIIISEKSVFLHIFMLLLSLITNNFHSTAGTANMIQGSQKRRVGICEQKTILASHVIYKHVVWVFFWINKRRHNEYAEIFPRSSLRPVHLRFAIVRNYPLFVAAMPPQRASFGISMHAHNQWTKRRIKSNIVPMIKLNNRHSVLF